jgi:hypothetical protein
MSTIAAASWNMDQMMPISSDYSTPFDHEGFMSQPFTSTASGLPSRLRLAGGNVSWSMQVKFEIWCDGQRCAQKVTDTAGYDNYSLNGYAFNLSFDDIADRKPIQAGKPCELRIATLSSTMGVTFGVQLTFGDRYVPDFGSVTGLPYGDVGERRIYMDLTVD